MEWVLGWIVRLGMFGVMLGMGLTLSLDDFRRIAARPQAVVLGTLLQLLAMPLVALALAHAFGADAAVATGLVVLAACPGGVMSNVLCHLGKADGALSITLTATATLIALFTIPLWTQAALAGFGAPTHGVDMPILATALDLGAFTVLPVGVGMLAVHTWPSLAAREPALTRASTAVMVVALVVEGLERESPPLDALAGSWRPAVLLLGAALALGVGGPLAGRLCPRETATIAVELCVKNGVLALFVLTQSLGTFVAAMPVFVVLTLQLPVAVGVLALYNVVERQRSGADPAA